MNVILLVEAHGRLLIMSKNIPCEQIQHLKRANFWLCKDRIKVKSLMRQKLESVVELNKLMQQIEYCYLKYYTKQRNKLLDEHSLLIDLHMRIIKISVTMVLRL